MGHDLERIKIRSDNMPVKTHYVYIFQCGGGKRYCGYTAHVVDRFVAHLTKEGAKFTRSFPPLHLLHLEKVESYLDAVKREIAIKKLMRNRCKIQYRVAQEYQGVFPMIQELLFKYDSSYVKRKLNAIEQEDL
jgi:putative endonuclease